MVTEQDWKSAVSEFEALIVQGRTVEAIERFYADDVIVFENRSMARAGRENCARWEREQLQRLVQPPRIQVRVRALNVEARVAFFEVVIRWTESNERMMRLEEVMLQRWEGLRIAQERFYYDGIVDESDDDERQTL
jgi:ketosteroid isomerase-like protein